MSDLGTIVARQTVIPADWLQDVNNLRYGNSLRTRGTYLLQYTAPGAGAVGIPAQTHMDAYVTPMSYGAVGDGATDDLAALKLALESGFVVDGEGKTYAVNGTLAPNSIKGLRNITLLQTADKTLTNYQTLDLRGRTDYFLHDVNINMGVSEASLFSDDGNNGLYCGGTQDSGTGVTTYAGNFFISRVRVTGNGCGTGIHIRHAVNFVMTSSRVANRTSASTPDPTNDSQNGIQINNSFQFSLDDCEVDSLRTRLAGVAQRKWTRGFLFAEIREAVITNCRAISVDQGFDFSGAYNATLGYTGNRNWVLSASNAARCETYGFKFANVTRQGLVIGCMAIETSTIGFVFSPSAVALPGGQEELNTGGIDVVGCRSIITLGNGWSGSGSQGFRIMSNLLYPTYPRRIRFLNCSVDDPQSTATTASGFLSDATPLESPTTGFNQNTANYCLNCFAENTTAAAFSGIGAPACQVTGSAVQSIALTATWTTVDWDVDMSDPIGMHNPASNNSTAYIKVSGRYQLLARLPFAANATGDRRLRLLLNGVVIDRTLVIAAPAAAVNCYVETSTSLFLKPGDNVRVEAFQSSGGALDALRNEGLFSVTLLS